MDSKTLVKLVIIDIMIKNIVIMWVILIRQYFYSYVFSYRGTPRENNM